MDVTAENLVFHGCNDTNNSGGNPQDDPITVKVFPNPTTGVVNIERNTTLPMTVNIVRNHVHSTAIFTRTYADGETPEIDLVGSGQQRGIFIVIVSFPNENDIIRHIVLR